MDYLSLAQQLGYQQLHRTHKIQTLWGGYGELVRLYVDNESIIVKHITLPRPPSHPKGWNTELAHQRKIRSYQAELHWYQDFVQTLHSECLAPLSIKTIESEHRCLIVMQDLMQLGFVSTSTEANDTQLESCLKWLAWFHASHIGNEGEGLWESGTYWHLETRPDELRALNDHALKANASKINDLLNNAPFQTLVHGDAKLANFCFTEDGTKAAAVDFQYVGRGCAMKDVTLFMSSAIDPNLCASKEKWLLDTYFQHLQIAIEQCQPQLRFSDIEAAWRPLFCIAWADFHRFVKGWSPTHWKINQYTEALSLKAIRSITH